MKRSNKNDFIEKADFPTLIAHSPNPHTPTIKVVLVPEEKNGKHYAYLFVRGEVNNKYAYWSVCLGLLSSKSLRRFFNETAKTLNELIGAGILKEGRYVTVEWRCDIHYCF